MKLIMKLYYYFFFFYQIDKHRLDSNKMYNMTLESRSSILTGESNIKLDDKNKIKEVYVKK